MVCQGHDLLQYLGGIVEAVIPFPFHHPPSSITGWPRKSA